jgi:hypothetical protein
VDWVARSTVWAARKVRGERLSRTTCWCSCPVELATSWEGVLRLPELRKRLSSWLLDWTQRNTRSLLPMHSPCASYVWPDRRGEMQLDSLLPMQHDSFSQTHHISSHAWGATALHAEVLIAFGKPPLKVRGPEPCPAGPRPNPDRSDRKRRCSLWTRRN